MAVFIVILLIVVEIDMLPIVYFIFSEVDWRVEAERDVENERDDNCKLCTVEGD